MLSFSPMEQHFVLMYCTRMTNSLLSITSGSRLTWLDLNISLATLHHKSCSQLNTCLRCLPLSLHLQLQTVVAGYYHTPPSHIHGQGEKHMHIAIQQVSIFNQSGCIHSNLTRNFTSSATEVLQNPFFVWISFKFKQRHTWNTQTKFFKQIYFHQCQINIDMNINITLQANNNNHTCVSYVYRSAT